MSKRPQATLAEEPDGGNPHIRLRGGPREATRPGLLNKIMSVCVSVATLALAVSLPSFAAEKGSIKGSLQSALEQNKFSGRVIDPGSRTIPSRILPVPDTVSPALQQVIARPPKEPFEIPTTDKEWKALATPSGGNPEQISQQVAEMAEKFGVTVVPQMFGGVHCYLVTPKVLKPANRNRLLLDLHASGFLWGAGEASSTDSIVISGLTGYKVIAVDYRMPPDHPFPAGMDDATRVWKTIVRLITSANIGIFGSSAGGGMALSLVQRAKKEGLPLPGAVLSDSPWSDLSKTGDSYYTNAGVDNGHVASDDDFWESVAKLYANGRSLKDPQLSPVYGDFTRFPPTFLVSGTRDAFLSNTVRVQEKLLRAGVLTQLVVEEGQSHGWLSSAIEVNAPEGVEVYSYITQFFDEHLGR